VFCFSSCSFFLEPLNPFIVIGLTVLSALAYCGPLAGAVGLTNDADPFPFSFPLPVLWVVRAGSRRSQEAVTLGFAAPGLLQYKALFHPGRLRAFFPFHIASLVCQQDPGGPFLPSCFASSRRPA